MKKYSILTRILTLALVLALSLTGFAFADDLKETYTYEGVFKMNYPTGWECDSDDSDDDETYRYLGMVFSPEVTGMNLELYMSYYEQWADFSLYSASEEETKEYIEILLSDFEDEEMTYVETIATQADGIPFVITTGIDSEGPFYYAETMTNGWAICVYAYAYTDDDYDTTYELKESDYQLFLQMLTSFTAIR